MDSNYDWMIWLRRGILIFSSLSLAINIGRILKNKTYEYNSIKLFMWLQIFYFLAMIVILPHNQSITTNSKYIHSINQINNTIKSMIDNNTMIWCALQAYCNLASYNISYLFAVFISLYVHKVLNNTHLHFMKTHLKFILGGCFIILLGYSVPFYFSFQPNFSYSFGPSGYNWGENYYLLYCGITQRNEEPISKVLSCLNMMLIPIGMFITHSVILYQNWKKTKLIRHLQEFNPRYWFIIRTGLLSLIIFIIQSINFIKYFLIIIIGSSSGTFFDIFMLILNTLFDFAPIFLIIYYFRIHPNSTIKKQYISADTSLITNISQ